MHDTKVLEYVYKIAHTELLKECYWGTIYLQHLYCHLKVCVVKLSLKNKDLEDFNCMLNKYDDKLIIVETFDEFVEQIERRVIV